MNLHIGIGKGDVITKTIQKTDFVKTALKLANDNKNVVWLLSSKGCEAETLIVVTEEVNLKNYLPLFESEEDVFFFENKTYNDAYIVARDMREGNPLCFGG